MDLTHVRGDIGVFRSTKFLEDLGLASTQVFGDIKVGKMGAIAIDEPFFVQLSDKNRFRIVATQQKWSRSGRRTALHVLAPVPILLLLLLFLLLALQLCPPIY